MSKNNIFNNEDIQTKMSILELMSGITNLKHKQIDILKQKDFNNQKFLENIQKYINRGEKDYEKYLNKVKQTIIDNITLMELTNNSNFVERELQRAFREEQKVNYKQKSLELKKEILSKLILYINNSN